MKKLLKYKPNKIPKQNKMPIFVIVIFIILIVFFSVFLLFGILAGCSLRALRDFGDNVALIHIDDIIITGESQQFVPYGVTYSDDIINNIDYIIGNPNFKAIIFEINSPGGSAVASSEIADAIKKANAKGITTIAVIKEQGTSGAYWVASACDYIIVHPLSATGSIGVLASYLEFSGLLETYNITYEKLTGGEHKDIMSPYRPLTDKERTMLQERIDMIHNIFIGEIVKNRNLSEDHVRKLATGIFYLGKEAKDFGLVDALGGREDAIKYIEEKHDIEASITEFKKEISFFSTFSQMQSKNSYWIGRGIGASLIENDLFRSLNIRA